MGTLTFRPEDVRPLVEHSISAPKQGTGYGAGNKPLKEPHLILVHDQGIYLMSNGVPRLKGEGERNAVAYAKGCHPEEDANWYDRARNLVGGDDFAEYLPWAVEIKGMIDNGASEIVINFNARGISLLAKYPPGSKGAAEMPRETIDEFVKRLQRMTRTKILALDPKSGSIRVWKMRPAESAISAIRKQRPDHVILNGASVLEIAKAAESHRAAEAHNDNG